VVVGRARWFGGGTVGNVSGMQVRSTGDMGRGK
jgi:hypothetical protein